MTKAFMGFLVAALVLGVALGAAFAGGVAFGKSQDADTGQPQAFGRFPQGEGAQPGSQFNRQGQDQRAALQQGERQGADGRRPGASGVFGTIQSVEGTQLTVETRQGTAMVSIGTDTRVYRLADASSEDLQPQSQVRVTGPRSDDGLVEAASVVIVPEGGQDAIFPGGGRRPSP